MKTAIIIYGPQGTGKTLHAEAIAKYFRKTEIAEDGHPHHFRWNKPFPDNYLVLTHDEEAARRHSARFGSTLVPIADARRAAGV